MGIPVMIIGKSGAGKSTSLRNFGEDELYLIKVLGKPLPFRKTFKSTFETDDYQAVAKALKKTPKEAIVIDDAGYLITNHFMNNHASAGKGNGVFTLYNEIGDRFWRNCPCSACAVLEVAFAGLVEYVINDLPSEKIVYFMMHEDKNDAGDIKPKTIGKLLDEKVCLEGMFTIVLRCMTDNDKHVFRTKTTGADVTKAPIDMFEDEEMDNDLKLVDTAIREYYGMIKKREEETNGET
mgnify:CR=1 FL=1